jgi:hypothetical protein
MESASSPHPFSIQTGPVPSSMTPPCASDSTSSPDSTPQTLNSSSHNENSTLSRRSKISAAALHSHAIRSDCSHVLDPYKASPPIEEKPSGVSKNPWKTISSPATTPPPHPPSNRPQHTQHLQIPIHPSKRLQHLEHRKQHLVCRRLYQRNHTPPAPPARSSPCPQQNVSQQTTPPRE